MLDWTDYNALLFQHLSTGTSEALAPLVWLGSYLLGNYWLAPLLVTVLWWSARRHPDLRRSVPVQTEVKSIVVALVLAALAVATLKLLVAAPRPFSLGDTHTAVLGETALTGSFPSGHAAYAMVVATSLWNVIDKPLRVLLVVYVAIVGWSRIAIGAHFPLDVLGGWAVGAFSSATAIVWVRGLQRLPASPGGAFWYVVALTLALLDQLTKGIAASSLVQGSGYPVTSFFNFVHLRNDGVAFSLLAGEGVLARAALIGIGLSVSAWLMLQLRGARMRLETVGYCLILGGAAGNLLDRMGRGAVVDFLDFHYAGLHWPAFNFADVFIVSGAMALILSTLYAGEQTTQHKPTPL